jgi:hypothetical protein
MYPFEWGSKNITDWPVCEELYVNITKSARHMHCDITGRPCCIQMHGQCRITSKEYCDFVRGYYHPEATLCSQVFKNEMRTIIIHFLFIRFLVYAKFAASPHSSGGIIQINGTGSLLLSSFMLA